ncbi:MAG: hypothetical protein ACRDP7_12885 [Trebonia sp.]
MTLPVPVSLAGLLAVFGPLFTAPSYRTFCGLACGFWAHGLPPDRTGKRGRPRIRGDRLPALDGLAATTAFTQVTVTRYGKTAAINAAALTCRWPTVFGTRPVTVVLIRDRSVAGYDLALVTTDTAATAAQMIERYAARWSIEVAIEDARQVFGAGQACNRTARAVERTVPFQLACQAIATCWYATAGHDPTDVADHRARAPWYTSKTQPSTADMAAKLRRVIIAARFKASRPDQPTTEESASSAWPGRTQRHNRESRGNSASSEIPGEDLPGDFTGD